MDVKNFYYHLPEELIAQDPLEDRSNSRLMILNKTVLSLTIQRLFRHVYMGFGKIPALR